MKLEWGIFAPCINEEQLIEAKIEWGLRLGMEVSIVEGHHPNYTDVNELGLSTDQTTEILESYSDQIHYHKAGRVQHEKQLRDIAYNNLPENLDIVIMSDIDEFFLEKDLNRIDKMFRYDKNLKEILTNSYIFLDDEYCAPHIKRRQGQPIKFNSDTTIYHGEFHERIFRYNKFYGYDVTPFLVNDLHGRNLFSHPIYYDQRMLREDIYMLHYKNFKKEEAKKRLKMYEDYQDGVKDHDTEWDKLLKNKIRYEDKHPSEIQELLAD